MNHEAKSNREKHRDQLLDGALANYANAEPRAGLEDRILANLRTQPAAETSSWFNWKWMVASAAAAVLLIALFLSPWKRQQSPIAPSSTASNRNNVAPNRTQTNGTQASKTPPRATTLASAARPMTAKWHAPRAAAASGNRQQLAAVPHQAVFPSPVAPSAQERMLLSYVKQTPREVLVAMSEEQQQHEQEWLQEMDRSQKSVRSPEDLK